MYFDNKDSFLQPQVTQHGSHMVMTNVHKETKVKHWNIDTRFRDDYDNYSQIVSGAPIPWYTFTLPQPINDVKSVSVNNAEIPISFFNVSTALGNNVMNVDTSFVSIPDGFYSSATLKTAVNAALAAASMSTIVFDVSSNGNTSIRNGAGKTVVISFAVKASNTCNGATVVGGTATANFDKYQVKSKLGWLLGFRKPTYTVTNGSLLNSENIMDLTGPRYLYLVVDEFTNSSSNSFISPLPTSIINKNILAKITMDYAHYTYGQVITANPWNGLLIPDIRSYNGKVNLQKLKIQLVNEYGTPINLNGLDFSFCLEIAYE